MVAKTMLFRQLYDRESCTYTYLIGNPKTQEAILIDPVLDLLERDLQLLQELKLTLKYCLETHIHADHITGTGRLRELTGCQGILPVNAMVNCADRFLVDGEIIALEEIEIEAIETLGHTDSHMAYFVNKDRILTGDALFIRGCGRTDFQGGDPGLLYDSVTKKLFALHDRTLVYPGHDYRGQTVSTIGEEKQYNPRFVGRDRAEFIEFMNDLHLPNPQKMMEAVPANTNCGKLKSIL